MKRLQGLTPTVLSGLALLVALYAALIVPARTPLPVVTPPMNLTAGGTGSFTGLLTATGGLNVTGASTFASDVTLTADSTGGNLGAKTELIGLPRIKLIGGGQGTNPGGQTITLFDDSPDGEYAAIDGDVTVGLSIADYKYGSGALAAIFAATASANDGFIYAEGGGSENFQDMESVGLLVKSTATLAAGDLALVLVDDTAPVTFTLPAVATANKWTWIEIDISSLNAGTGDSIVDVKFILTAQGAAALGEFTLYLDIGYVWDADDEEALGVAIQQDGVLGVINTETGAPLVELTDYFVHYETGNDFIVYISDQSAADIAILAAY